MAVGGRGLSVCGGVLVSFAVACGGGGGSPSQPSPLPTQPSNPASSWTLRGVITETLAGTPLEGATVTLTLASGAVPLTTGAGGVWELSRTTSEGAVAVTASAAGYVERRLHLRPPSGSREVAIDLIRDAAPFSVPYYRQIVRDAFDEPQRLQPLRRWTANPVFYVRTRNPRTNAPILPSELDMLTRVIRDTVPQMTGGQLGAGAVETGMDERTPRTGEIHVRFVDEPEADYCGTAYVGANPGEITINYACATRCGAFAPRTVAHEVGHALGFYHVDTGAVMNTVWFARDCDVTAFSEAERHHARVAYARAPGNVDVDVDPSSSLLLQAPAAPPPIISCR